jgi:formylmethanofuran dehydrogenase subunit C
LEDAAVAISTASCGHVNENSSGFESGKCAGVRVKKYRANVGGITDDGENDVRFGCDVVGGVSDVSSDVEEWLGFGRSAVEDGECVAGADEMGAHGLAHYSGADPSQARV